MAFVIEQAQTPPQSADAPLSHRSNFFDTGRGNVPVDFSDLKLDIASDDSHIFPNRADSPYTNYLANSRSQESSPKNPLLAKLLFGTSVAYGIGVHIVTSKIENPRKRRKSRMLWFGLPTLFLAGCVGGVELATKPSVTKEITMPALADAHKALRQWNDLVSTDGLHTFHAFGAPTCSIDASGKKLQTWSVLMPDTDLSTVVQKGICSLNYKDEKEVGWTSLFLLETKNGVTEALRLKYIRTETTGLLDEKYFVPVSLDGTESGDQIIFGLLKDKENPNIAYFDLHVYHPKSDTREALIKNVDSSKSQNGSVQVAPTEEEKAVQDIIFNPNDSDVDVKIFPSVIATATIPVTEGAGSTATLEAIVIPPVEVEKDPAPQYDANMTSWTTPEGKKVAGIKILGNDHALIQFDKANKTWFPVEYSTWQEGEKQVAGVTLPDGTKKALLTLDTATGLWMPESFQTGIKDKFSLVAVSGSETEYSIDGVTGLTISKDGSSTLVYGTETFVFPNADLSLSVEGKLRVAGYEWNGKEWTLILPGEFPKTPEELPSFSLLDVYVGNLYRWYDKVFVQMKSADKFKESKTSRNWELKSVFGEMPLDTNGDAVTDIISFSIIKSPDLKGFTKEEMPFRASKSLVNIIDLNTFAGFVDLLNKDGSFAYFPTLIDYGLVNNENMHDYNSVWKFITGYPHDLTESSILAYSRDIIVPSVYFGQSANMDLLGGVTPVSLLREDTDMAKGNKALFDAISTSPNELEHGIFTQNDVGRRLWGLITVRMNP